MSAAYYLGRNKYCVRDGELYYGNKRVIRENSVKSCVKDAFRETKGGGSRKIKYHIRQIYSGVSEDRIQCILDKSKTHARMQARFTNNPVFKPVTSRGLQVRHQIDLIDMRPNEVWVGKNQYRYILSLMDVFSRYIWLRPLASKKSSEISNHLESIYREHGPPRVLQSDNGKEFEGSVLKLMKELGVKIIRSAPYHPQSQGKCERSHRTIRKKILYDLLQMGGTNWVNQLQEYAHVLNNAARKALGYRTSFLVYYGRQNNRMKYKLGAKKASSIRKEQYVSGRGVPRDTDLKRNEVRRKGMLSKVFQVSRNYNEHMKRYGLKRHPPSVYDIHDTVLVRVCHPKKKPRMNYLKKGVILKRRLKLGKYYIAFEDNDGLKNAWFSIKDITSLTRSEEIKRRKMDPNLINKQADKSKYNIPLSRGEWVYRYGFTVIFDPLPNGDCQFSAITDQLKHIGIHRSPASLRQEVVNDLRTRPYLVDGTALENFLGQNNLEAYLQSMSRRGTHGDHITVARVAEIFNVQFIIFSSIGPHGTRIISPSGVYDDDIPTLFLAHDSEDEGEHYYSIQGDATSRATALSIFDTSNRITMQQGVGRRNSKRSNEGSWQTEGDLDGRDYPGSDGRRKERVDDVGCRNGVVVGIGEKDRRDESEDNVISANKEGGEAHGTDQDGGEKDGIDQEESEIDDTDKKSGKKDGIDKSEGELSAGEYPNEIDGLDTGGGSVSSRDQNRCSKSWSDDGGGDVGDRNGGNQSGRNGEGIEVGEIDVEKGEVSGRDDGEIDMDERFEAEGSATDDKERDADGRCENEGDISWNHKYLPPEVLNLIIEMVLHNDCRMALPLSLVSQHFRARVVRFYHDNPELKAQFLNRRNIHVRSSIALDLGLRLSEGAQTTVSVRQIWKLAGKSSGLAMRLKDILHQECGGQWWHAWLVLVPIVSRQGMFRILRIL